MHTTTETPTRPTYTRHSGTVADLQPGDFVDVIASTSKVRGMSVKRTVTELVPSVRRRTPHVVLTFTSTRATGIGVGVEYPTTQPVRYRRPVAQGGAA